MYVVKQKSGLQKQFAGYFNTIYEARVYSGEMISWGLGVDGQVHEIYLIPAGSKIRDAQKINDCLVEEITLTCSRRSKEQIEQGLPAKPTCP